MKNKILATLMICCMASMPLWSQVTNNLELPTSINEDGAAPDASAILDVQSTTKGVLVPRMTTAERTAISTPATGLLVFNTDDSSFWYFNGTAWADLSIAGEMTDNDGDTKIQVEESADEDIIRFDAGGDQVMVIKDNRRVGINTNTPGQTLEVVGTDPDHAATFQLGNSDLSHRLFFYPGRENDPNPYIMVKEGDPIRFVTDEGGFSEKVRITSDGDMGIGTQTPDARLDIEGGALLAQGTTGGTPVSGAGTRMMWIPAKSAFRAGNVGSDQWDDANIGLWSSVAGGTNNIASVDHAFVGGGNNNTSSGFSSFIGAGKLNTTTGTFSFIGGGQQSNADGDASFVGGGFNNHTTAVNSFIGGGANNVASGIGAVTMGGGSNTAEGYSSFASGVNATTKSYLETVFGTFNTEYTAMSVTDFNAADRLFVIGNGTDAGSRSNAVTVMKSGDVGFGTDTPDALVDIEGGALLAQGTTGSTPVSGAGTRLMWVPEKKAFRTGEVDAAQWDAANIGESSGVIGGLNNTASGVLSFVGGGIANIASGIRSSVVGGGGNDATAYEAFIGGGFTNTASGENSFIGSGNNNVASGDESFVGAGAFSAASGNHSFVGGGERLLAKSFGEAVFGTYNSDYTPNSTTAIDAADRLFVIGNGTGLGDRSNAMTVLKSGDVGIGVDPVHPLHMASGAHCTAGGVWTNASDRRLKKGISAIGYGLQEILALQPVSYQMRSNDEKQVGFIAQEVQELLPELISGKEGNIEKGETLGMSYGNLTAVLVKAVQEQQEIIENGKLRMEKLEAKNAGLGAEVKSLQSQLAEMDGLKNRMAKLEAALLQSAAHENGKTNQAIDK